VLCRGTHLRVFRARSLPSPPGRAARGAPRHLAPVLLLLIAAGCAISRPTPPPLENALPGRQTPQRMAPAHDTRKPGRYLLYLPPGYDARRGAWPLLLFLHGSGERGSHLERVKRHGPPPLLQQGRQFPFIVVSPQCPEGETWSVAFLDQLLREVQKRYRVDPDRIYVTGLSLGGYGTWSLAEAYPERFAAVAPVCGGGDPSRAAAMRRLPVWAFHGEKDLLVPVEESRVMVEALRKAGGNVRFTAYPDKGHDCWTATYETPELYRWLLEQKREPPRGAGHTDD